MELTIAKIFLETSVPPCFRKNESYVFLKLLRKFYEQRALLSAIVVLLRILSVS